LVGSVEGSALGTVVGLVIGSVVNGAWVGLVDGQTMTISA
jgi:hypothetical protein